MASGINDRDIAYHILMAQVASDGGKDIKEIRSVLPHSFKTWQGGYRSKDYHILLAIKGILRSRDSVFRFRVSKVSDEDDDEMRRVFIAYFEFVDEQGIRRQISFHSFRKEVGKFVSDRMKIEWDRKSSRETAKFLAENLSAF